MPSARKRKESDAGKESAKKRPKSAVKPKPSPAVKREAASPLPRSGSSELSSRQRVGRLATPPKQPQLTPRTRSSSVRILKGSSSKKKTENEGAASPAASPPKVKQSRPPALLKRSSSIADDLNGFIERAHSFIDEGQPKRAHSDGALMSVATAAFVDLILFSAMGLAGLVVAWVFKWCQGELGWCEHDALKMWIKTLSDDDDATVVRATARDCPPAHPSFRLSTRLRCLSVFSW